MRKSVLNLSLLLFLSLISCSKSNEPVRDVIDLSGTWRFSADTAKTGITSQLYNRQLPDEVRLPGTLDENNKGLINTNKQETMHLSRELMYSGMAWYQKDVTIPENWSGKYIRLVMERTKPSQVFIDGRPAGSNTDLLTPQIYNLSEYLSPGPHKITILINNSNNAVPEEITGSHAWTEHTQSNWNGIIGKFCLEALDQVHIENIQVYSDIMLKKINVRLKISNPSGIKGNTDITIKADGWNTSKIHHVAAKKYSVDLRRGDNQVEFTYEMGKNARLWSEFDPALYKLSVTMKNKKVLDRMESTFGMRKFSTDGTQFTINSIKTFLRGKHDACVFPLTGHPPMDVESWRRVFRIAKSYNINFYRFHSWTPPLAAFEAADIEGVYLQPELPFWGSFGTNRNSGLNSFLIKEGDHIFENYGTHASFVMFALGNELSGNFDTMKELVAHFRGIDNRHLIAYGSNNYLGFRGTVDGEDYYAACRVGADKDTTLSTQIRGSFSFADAWEGGYINGRYPSTDVTYTGAIKGTRVPSVGTEVGQYQVYPDYDEIKKYTGVMKPWNLEIFRDRLKENNLSQQADDFFRASGALSVICYKADVEMAIRTPGFGGFHLLDLQDFPGQGTALVGLLDAFMDSKGLITPAAFSQFCNSVVPLAVMSKYCWTNNEQFRAKIRVANYSESDLTGQSVTWQLKNSRNEVIYHGTNSADLKQGQVSDVTSLNLDLLRFSRAEKLTLTIKLDSTVFGNSYPVWIYPAEITGRMPEDILISHKVNAAVYSKLREGGKVLLQPDFADVKDVTVGGLFTTDYWNWRMFKGISESIGKPVSPGTMGYLINTSHPLFRDFPTDFHSDWQWWVIAKNSRPLILDNTSASYKPVIQVIDNIERNHKLGILMEFNVGKGKLLICMTDLNKIRSKPEGRQYFNSIIRYMSSDSFNPAATITEQEADRLFRSRPAERKISGIENISY